MPMTSIPYPRAGAARPPLEAVRDLVASRARARAVARGMPPLTFAPDFGASTGFRGDLRLDGTLIDQRPHERDVAPSEVVPDLRATFALNATPGAASWPAVITHQGAPLTGASFSSLASEDKPEDEEYELGEDLGEIDSDPRDRFLAKRVVLRLRSPASANSGERVRMGALDLHFRRMSAATPAPTEWVKLTFVLAVAKIGAMRGLRVRLIAEFPLENAVAAEPDRPPLDRDLPAQAVMLEDAPDRPLLLPMSSNVASPVEAGSLHVTEQFGWGLDPQLAMSINLSERVGAANDLERFIVIGRLPMQVARLHVPRLSRRADATTHQVAIWSSGAATGGSWRLRDPDETAQLILGPQGLGEAMEKGLATGGYADVAEGMRVAFRLSPPAIVEIDPSPLDSGFVEPPWNLDRIFGRPGEIEHGARLRRAAFELLYGMAGAISDRGLRDARLRLSDVARALRACRRPG